MLFHTISPQPNGPVHLSEHRKSHMLHSRDDVKMGVVGVSIPEAVEGGVLHASLSQALALSADST